MILWSALLNSCVQIRNLVLSAFPRAMKLPDPFQATLRVEGLEDMKKNARVLGNFTVILRSRTLG